jgi:thiol-disulfide isomerase/thioredoxin
MLAALLLSHTAAAAAPRAFVVGSYARILAEHRERPLIVAFWSLACSHCQEELAALGELAGAHPATAIVLVSTDTPEDAAAITTTLRRHRLERAASWVFADDVPERLRFEIDRRWRGELPRTHLIAPGEPARVLIGRADPAELAQWLHKHTPR